MIVKYEMPLRFSREDLAPDGHIRAHAILYAFQTAAGEHAQREGLGFQALLDRNLIWVVTKIKYKVLGELRPDTDYTVVTYPRHTTSLIYDRDFYLKNAAGEDLVIASSQWCLVNFETRRIEQTDVDFKGEYRAETAFPRGIERIRPRELTPAGRYTVAKEDLDGNEHMNNCRYADLALGALGAVSARVFTISFVKETRLGDVIDLFTAPGGVAAGKHDGSVVFTAGIGE